MVPVRLQNADKVGGKQTICINTERNCAGTVGNRGCEKRHAQDRDGY